jgi:hypothetical protein
MGEITQFGWAHWREEIGVVEVWAGPLWGRGGSATLAVVHEWDPGAENFFLELRIDGAPTISVDLGGECACELARLLRVAVRAEAPFDEVAGCDWRDHDDELPF